MISAPVKEVINIETKSITRENLILDEKQILVAAD
jgi:hypothetical protein